MIVVVVVNDDSVIVGDAVVVADAFIWIVFDVGDTVVVVRVEWLDRVEFSVVGRPIVCVEVDDRQDVDIPNPF